MLFDVSRISLNNAQSMICWYERYMRGSRKEEIVEKRLEVLRLIDGDVFYKLSQWPREMERLFWRKPVCDTGVLKLLLFAVGNGCPPNLMSEWILMSRYWCVLPAKCLKRGHQIDYILENLEKNKKKWFYFDIHHKRMAYLNGNFKNN